MNREITNKNLHLLIPGKVSLFTKIYVEKQQGTPLEALRRFYQKKGTMGSTTDQSHHQ